MSDTALLCEVIALVRGMDVKLTDHVRASEDRHREIDTKLTNHMYEEEKEIESQSHAIVETNARMDSLASSIQSYMDKQDLTKAFPNGDLIGHKQAHEEWIQTMQAIRGVFVDAGKALAKAGIIGLAVFLLYAMWNGLLQGPK